MEGTTAFSGKSESFDLASASAGPHSSQPKPSRFPENHAVLDRLRCIEVVAWWEGAINAAALTNWFGVSRKKATQDIAYYRTKNPGSLEYNTSRKVFEITPTFQPLYTNATESEYLQHLERCSALKSGTTGISLDSPGTEVAIYPRPRVSAPLFRGILRAVRSGSTIRCHYLEHDDQSEHLNYRDLLFSPVKLVNTHIGWHIRIYDHHTKSFDLIRLNRIFGEPSRAWEHLRFPPDRDWENEVLLVGEPSASLSFDEIALTSADWGISDSNPLVVTSRECLVGIVMFYWKAIDSRLTFRVIDSPSENWLDIPKPGSVDPSE